jgi:hypothetical protein
MIGHISGMCRRNGLPAVMSPPVDYVKLNGGAATEGTACKAFPRVPECDIRGQWYTRFTTGAAGMRRGLPNDCFCFSSSYDIQALLKDDGR